MVNLTKRILVVDDDQGILDSFEVLLGDRYDLIRAENGYEALRILESNPPQLIFLDIKMPGIDGIDILKKLQKDKKNVEVMIDGRSGTRARWASVKAPCLKGFNRPSIERVPSGKSSTELPSARWRSHAVIMQAMLAASPRTSLT